MTTCLETGGFRSIFATTALGAALASFASAPSAHAAPPAVQAEFAPSAELAPDNGRANGGVAGIGGGGGGCPYSHDDGTGENNLGFGADAWQGPANAYVVEAACGVVNTIQVAWGTLNSGDRPALLTIYDDPNDDGDPSDVTPADAIAQTTGIAVAPGGNDTFQNYGIGDVDLTGLGVIFVVGLADVTAADFPGRFDTGPSQMMSYIIATSDPTDPFAGTFGLIDGFGFPGNMMIRATFIDADECEDCLPVTEGDYDGSTLDNTGDTDDTSCASGDVIDAWYCYTASCNGTATVSVCNQADFDTTLAVFDACGGAEIACNDDADGCDANTSLLTFGATAGTTYYVRVSGWNGNSGDYTLSISCDGELVNDECEDRLEIVDGVTPFNTSDATTNGPEHPDCDGFAFGDDQVHRDIWFNYTALCTGNLTVSTCEELGGSAAFDTRLAVYAGTDCPVTDEDLIDCNDDDPENDCGTGAGGFKSTVVIPVTAGETYKIRVGGFDEFEAGAGELLVDCDPVNDECENALPIFDGLTDYDTSGAETDGPDNPEGTCNDFGSNVTGSDIWYDYVATCTGDLLVTTCSDLGGAAGYDTDLVVYSGTDCPVTNDRLLGCNDDDPENPCGTGAPFASTVMVPVVAGESYKIRVGGWGDGDEGPGTLLIECTGSGPPPIINEIRIDQPGGDDDEYLELKGNAGLALDGLSVVVIGDGSGGSGVIEEVIDLTGSSIGPSGLFLIAEDNDTFGAAADLIVDGLNFENSDNVTFLVVSGFTGAEGDDLDTDDDCSLDVLPWALVSDAVGLVEEPNPPAGTECVYGADLGFVDIGPDNIFVPAHVYRCVPDGNFLIGAFDPDEGVDTPGAVNQTCCNSLLRLVPMTPVNPLGYDAGDTVVLVLSMENLCEPVAGFQAFLSFDEAELQFVGGTYTTEPFGQPIIDPIMAVGGEINVASGIDQTIGQTPSADDAVLVELEFMALDSFCLPSSVAFRENNPPTRFTDASGGEEPARLSTDLPATCKADTNLDGEVGVDDLMAVIMDYGNSGECGADTNNDGIVDVDDLVQVILRWGPCPEE